MIIKKPTVHVQLQVTFLHIPLVQADIMNQDQGLDKQLFQHNNSLHFVTVVTLELVPL